MVVNSWRQKVPGSLGGGKLLSNGYSVSLWGDENVLETDGGNGCTAG